MARPRRGFLFDLDAKVLLEGLRIHREGTAEFYGLQVANRLRIEKISVYRSLRRLTALGLVERHGKDALPHALRGARALGRQHPVDSNRVIPRRQLPSLPRGARPRPRRRGR